jgi:hypothetical protein
MRHFVLLDAYADAGETAAMLLYKELDADYLLIDDKRGRKVAAIKQIKTIGSMGVLLQAKRAGLVASIAPLLASIDASRFSSAAVSLKKSLNWPASRMPSETCSHNSVFHTSGRRARSWQGSAKASESHRVVSS